MSTPIETNTEELRGILEDVYNLPARNSGSQPDLVIRFIDDVVATKNATQDALSEYITIVGGSAEAVLDALQNDNSPIIKIEIKYGTSNDYAYANINVQAHAVVYGDWLWISFSAPDFYGYIQHCSIEFLLDNLNVINRFSILNHSA